METLNYSHCSKIAFKTHTAPVLHCETRSWISKLEFIRFELNFSNTLISSCIFEPRTANSLLLLQEFNNHIKSLKKENNSISKAILEHENEMSHMYRTNTMAYIQNYQKSHNQLTVSIHKHETYFKSIKTEIFDYCEHVLRYQKS